MEYSREHMATLILEKISQHRLELKEQYFKSNKQIGHFYLDNLLPVSLVNKIYKKFPGLDETVLKKNLREYKYVAVQMDAYDPILEEVIYAFQDERVVKLIQEICELTSILPDKHLYAGGLSIMKKNNFLNPHLDNSHDKDRKRRRALNILYYVTPNWDESYGGNLEIWPNGLKNNPITISSKFNRLVVMATHQKSWHSVNKVLHDGMRCCVSNYYFYDDDQETKEFHITSFRGRPSQKFRNVILKLDTLLRTNVRKIFKKGITENAHKYRQNKN